MLTSKEKTVQAIDTKRVFLFSEAAKAFEGDRKAMREKLGGKGAGLAEMTESGVNVPPGITVLTSCCPSYQSANRTSPEAWAQWSSRAS
ncbi:MAG: hypothetical protein K2X29_09295 [Candidatus Obscuribacterales bacterium]|nr:hypothetical protein [Candidatus Obscuribacterales bacterium]